MKIHYLAIVALGICAPWSCPSFALTTPQSAAQEVAVDAVQKTINETMAIITSRTPESTQKNQLMSVLKTHFNIDTISQRVLGPSWHQVHTHHQSELAIYRERLIKDLVNTYFNILTKYCRDKNVQIKISEVTPVKNAPGAFYITSHTVDPQSHQQVMIKWAVQGNQILDLTVGSSSITSAKMNEYRSIMREQRGFSGLLKVLETRTQS